MAIDVLTNGVGFITLFVPELPELEVIKDKLRLMLIGRRIMDTTLRQAATLKTVRPTLASIRESRIRTISRYGKFLGIATDNKLHLCIHLMLNGALIIIPSDKPMTRSHLL
ncbi:hypothetical protein CH330_06025, partial [candidate division WOR-3 bacterium JGI_Cruoil_03_51_56]